jgi:aromatic-amino-acid transaminase
MFEGAGFTVSTYPYYDAATGGVRFPEMLAALSVLPEKSIVLLHACCHNPTGVDLSAAQWAELIPVLAQRKLIPYVDIAYQGFGDGISQDACAIRALADAGLSFFVASSFSKSFSLYGERVGALSVLCATKDDATRVLSQLKIVIRTNYSTPPTHGAQVVATVLTTPALRAMWEEELAGMRVRIKQMRTALLQKLQAAGIQQDMSFITQQKGMFSYSGLNKAQMERLRNEFGIYGVDSGRICVAALNSKNIDAVVAAIAKVS